jgi:hypothetical protein
MRWIDEPNQAFPKWPDHVLTTEPGEALGPAWVEYWKRILTDGYGLAASSRAVLTIDICARTFEEDATGQASARFRNSQNRQSEGIGSYVLRSEQFTFLQGKDEDSTEYGRRHLLWLLDHYQALKAALRNSEAWPLYERITRSHPLPVRLATMNGWFDLRAGQKGFGGLPSNDQELLAGMEPKKEASIEARPAES